MPFTLEQFLQVFARYNQAVYPMQFLLVTAALFAIFFAVRPNRYSSKFISTTLACFWLWMGIVYHLIFFSSINQAAFIFGAFFIIQAIILFYAGVLKKGISFHFSIDAKGITGMCLVVYALIVYPLLGIVFGHNYPYSPTFGLPCPTTIFTFGLFLWTDKRVPLYVLVIPFAWSLIGFSAAFSLGIHEDLGLPIAGFILTTILLWKKPQLIGFLR